MNFKNKTRWQAIAKYTQNNVFNLQDNVYLKLV